jgi:hypothetical protein
MDTAKILDYIRFVTAIVDLGVTEAAKVKALLAANEAQMTAELHDAAGRLDAAIAGNQAELGSQD